MSNTYTLNFNYGLGLVADGTGVLLNNELDDFTAKPGTANAYDLVGFNANLPGPGKRPLSSMTPTIVLKDGKPFLITGSPGGSRIITTVLQVIADVIDFHMPIDKAVGAPRLHNQWQPDQTYVEPGFAPAVLDALKARGHVIVPTEPLQLGQFDRGDPESRVHAAAISRRRRPPHARLAGGGVLKMKSPPSPKLWRAIFATRKLACQSKLRRSEDWSGRRDSNPRPRPWQGRALPLSYTRIR